MSTALFWCAYTKRNIYQSRALDSLRNCLSVWPRWGSNSDDLIKNSLLMLRLAICSHNLNWHWLNWTLLCNTMEVSMLRLAWLTIACVPARMTGLDFAKNFLLWMNGTIWTPMSSVPKKADKLNLSLSPGTKAIAVNKFTEKLSPANWIPLLVTMSAKLAK